MKLHKITQKAIKIQFAIAHQKRAKCAMKINADRQLKRNKKKLLNVIRKLKPQSPINSPIKIITRASVLETNKNV